MSAILLIAPSAGRAQIASETALPLITGSITLDLASLPPGLGAQIGVQRIQDAIVTLAIDSKTLTASPDSSGAFVFVLPQTEIGKPFQIRASLDELGLFIAEPVSGTVHATRTTVSLNLHSRVAAQARSPEDVADQDALRKMLAVERPHAWRTFDVVTDRAITNNSYSATLDPANLYFGRFNGDVLLGESVPCPRSGWTCQMQPRTQADAIATPLSTPTNDLTNQSGLSPLVQEIRTRGPDVLLFVHGFNTSMDGAEVNLAQLAFIAGWGGKPAIVYSWPSQGRLNGYTADSSVVNDSEEVAHFQTFLNDLVTALPGIRIHLVAHSMGHRLLFDTLLTSPRLAQAVVSAEYFAPDTLPGAVAPIAALLNASHIPETVFFNQDDLALRASQCLNHQVRLGEQRPPEVPGIMTFDATPYALSDGWGHEYFSNTLRVAQEFNQDINGAPTPDPILTSVPWLKNRVVPLQLTLQESAVKSGLACSIAGQLP